MRVGLGLPSMHVVPPAGSVDDDDVASVDEAVEQGGRAEVVVEVVAPGLPGDVAGDDGGASLVVPGQQDFLHQAGSLGVSALDLLEADLINHE